MNKILRTIGSVGLILSGIGLNQLGVSGSESAADFDLEAARHFLEHSYDGFVNVGLGLSTYLGSAALNSIVEPLRGSLCDLGNAIQNYFPKKARV